MKKIKLDEWLFYMPWIILITNTLLAQSYLSNLSTQIFTIIGIAGLLVKIFYKMRFKTHEIIFMGIMLLISTLIAYISVDKRILWLVIAICASINTDFYKTTKITFWTMLIETCIIVLSCVLLYKNIGTSAKGGLALGLGHPSILHGMISLLCAIYIYLWWNKLTILKVVFIEFLNIMLYQITLSRTGVIALSVILFMVFVYKILPSPKVLKMVSVVTVIVVIVFTITPIIYNKYPNNNTLVFLDNIMTGRLWQSRWYYRLSGVTLFGNYYAELYSDKPFALLDMGFFRLFLEYGIVAYTLILYSYIRVIGNAIKDKNIGMLFMCSYIMISSCTESLGTYVFFNVVMLSFGTLIYDQNKSKEKSHNVQIKNSRFMGAIENDQANNIYTNI